MFFRPESGIIYCSPIFDPSKVYFITSIIRETPYLTKYEILLSKMKNDNIINKVKDLTLCL